MEDYKDKGMFLLIEKARNLDSQAIANIFEHYYPKIYRYLYYRVNHKEEAEDLTSEVFVRLVKSIKNQKGNFDSWIYHIAKNLLIDYYRRKTVRKESNIEEDAQEKTTPYQGNNEPAMTEEELKQAMENLTDEQKEIIALRFIEGYDSEKISQITNKSIGAIKALQFRAIVVLKEFFNKAKKYEKKY